MLHSAVRQDFSICILGVFTVTGSYARMMEKNMGNSHEQRDIRLYLGRILKKINLRSQAAIRFYQWLEENEVLLNLDLTALKKRSGVKGKAYTKTGLKVGLQDEIYVMLGQGQTAPRPQDDDMVCNFNLLTDYLSLAEDEKLILLFLMRKWMAEKFDSLCDDLICKRLFDSESLLATALDLNNGRAKKLLNQGNLVKSGLIKRLRNSGRNDFRYEINSDVVLALSETSGGLATILKTLLGQPLATDLTWQDYDYIRRERDCVRDILLKVAGLGRKAINILIYGPPGTGKTELCKVVAQKLGKNLFAVGEEDPCGYEPDRSERLESLKLCQSLLAGQENALVLFDEMEDLIEKRWGSGSKVFLNRILEQNEVPTFWVTNDLDCFDPALLRRMTYAVELKLPNAAVRERQLAQLAKDYDVTLTGEDVRQIAGKGPVSIGVMATAVTVSAMNGGGADMVWEITSSLSKVVNHGRVAPNHSAHFGAFHPALINGGAALSGLEKLVGPHMPYHDYSLCIYGPPGTGKSAYLRHLAALMEMDILFKRASDILSKWVGGSEENIARAFEEAREQEAFLVFDEVDSLLSDRTGADKSWEVSQVNEMLTWMESHALPFACTTNLMDKIDQAALRRFTFKIKFDYMEAHQVALAYETFFNRPAPDDVLYLGQLTPGDFATVKKRLRFEGDNATDTLIVQLLEGECLLKKGACQPFGFRAVKPMAKLVSQGERKDG